MSRIIFSVSYEIRPECREEYLEIMKKIQENILRETGQNCSVFEDAKVANLMSEVYYLSGDAEYQRVLDFKDGSSGDLMDNIEKCLLNPDQVNIRTFTEVI